MAKSVPVILALGLALGLLAGCDSLGDKLLGKTITEVLPSQPTPVGGPSPIAIPVVTPAPVFVPNPPTPGPPPTAGNPGGTPTPAPGPTPAATPPPSDPLPDPIPPPTSNGCGLPSQSPAHSCAMQSSQFGADIEWAIDQVINQKAQFFDLTDQRGAKSPRVLNEAGYTANLVKFLGQRGYCAIWDGEEIAVKSSQGFNEQYDILTASGYVRRGVGAYRATCHPAWF